MKDYFLLWFVKPLAELMGSLALIFAFVAIIVLVLILAGIWKTISIKILEYRIAWAFRDNQVKATFRYLLQQVGFPEVSDETALHLLLSFKPTVLRTALRNGFDNPDFQNKAAQTLKIRKWEQDCIAREEQMICNQ